jgi:hypothetical protein
MYFNDVEAHEIATLYTRKFNEHLPEQYPRIGYVPAFIVEFVDRPGRPVCGCEQHLEGKFKKYNNNVGAVCAMSNEEQAELNRTTTLTNWDPTSTAQAFSHFSWEHSQSQVLICDIQGVENRFTDPQIHTMSGKGFGLGNLGQTGIRAFLLRHTCTDLCRAVGLQPIKAKDLNERQVQANFGSAPVHHAPPGSNLAAASGSQGGMTAKRVHGGHHNNNGGGGTSDVLIINDTPPAAAAPHQRGMSSSASTAFISHQASQAVINPSGRPPHQQQQHAHQSRDRHQQPPQSQQRHSSASTPSHSPSPSASPKAGPFRSLQQSPPVTAAPAPSSLKKTGLDDSDEALMASIMGD